MIQCLVGIYTSEMSLNFAACVREARILALNGNCSQSMHAHLSVVVFNPDMCVFGVCVWICIKLHQSGHAYTC